MRTKTPVPHRHDQRRGRVAVALWAAAGMLAAGAALAVASPAGAAPGDCDGSPADVQTGLTNVGFEADLAGWRQGAVTDSVAVVGADEHVAPYEGSTMARLGTPGFSNQPIGPNEICQDFVVDQATEAFVYNVFTYDYTGFDEFEFVLTVAAADGEPIVRIEQGAFGSGTALKTTGWRYVPVNLSGHLGETVRMTLSAGGTSDQLYRFWAYIDSATSGPPPDVIAPVTGGDVGAATGSVNVDPTTGYVAVSMPNGSKSDLAITAHASCPGGATPSSVVLFLDSSPFPMTASGGGAGAYAVTIPASELASGLLSIQVVCGGVPYIETIGEVTLIDPSGYITNAVTGQPVAGATATLYKVPSWGVGLGAGDPDGNCATIADKPSDASWTQAGATWNKAAPANAAQYELGNPYADPQEMDPKANPIVSGADGYYGWLVAPGCWFVTVSAPGYVSLTSPVVGVAIGAPVTDLHLALQPVAPPPPPPPPPPPKPVCTILRLTLKLFTFRTIVICI